MHGRAGRALRRSIPSRASKASIARLLSPAVLRRCDRRRPEDPPRRTALDHRGFDLQGRDLSFSTVVQAHRRGRGDGAQGPAGLVHLPQGVDAEWVKQLVAEHLVTITTKRGFQKLEWQKVRERNEALDCRVYARAAVWIAGADRWSEDKWRDLEDQVGPSLRTPTTRNRPSKPGVSPAQTRHPPSGRAIGSARAGSGSEELSWPGRPTNSMR